MSAALPVWVEYLRALALPIIAVLAAAIAYFQYRLAKQKREDDLFDRRFAFYLKAAAAWEGAAINNHQTGENTPEWDFRAKLAAEALFLFGPDVAAHLRDYKKPFCVHFSYIPNDDFTKPFEKYLRLGKTGDLKYE